MATHNHDGMVFETLHWKYFLKCEICNRWRLRRKRDIFWKAYPTKCIRLCRDDTKIRIYKDTNGN